MIFAVLVGLVLLIACAMPVKDRITQTATIDALLAGAYDGFVSGKEVLAHGDFGIGTFDRLDGEMIVFNGVIYQVKADGRVHRPDPDLKTPFATVCFFNADGSFPITATRDDKGVRRMVDEAVPNQNVFLAVRLTGDFPHMKVRSVPSQNKPYMPLQTVVKNQAEFVYENIRGTIVGFRCPPFAKGLNVPGYHFHFLSEDGTIGGHVLTFTVDRAVCAFDIANRFYLILPDEAGRLADIDLSRNAVGN